LPCGSSPFVEGGSPCSLSLIAGDYSTEDDPDLSAINPAG
jgi:hypothetical protein